MGGGLD